MNYKVWKLYRCQRCDHQKIRCQSTKPVCEFCSKPFTSLRRRMTIQEWIQ